MTYIEYNQSERYAVLAELYLTPAPIYLMTEPLVATGALDGNGDEIYALNNSVSSGELFDADLFHAGDGSKSNTRAWIPNATQYPEDGTIDMSIQGDGFGSIEARTNWIPLADSEWTFSFVHNVVSGVSYDIVSLNSKGDGTADVWRGDESTAVSLAVADTGLSYTPPLTSMVLTENINMELIPIVPTCAITMDSYALGAGETATVTFTFNTIPLGFAVGDIISPNGVISALTQSSDEWVYTATFTPTSGVSDATNVIAVSGALGEYADQWGNASTADSTSSNYTVDTVATEEIYINFVSNALDGTTAGITMNTASYSQTTPLSLVDKDNNATGVSIVMTDNVGEWYSATSGYNSGDDSYVMYDEQLQSYMYATTTSSSEYITMTISGLDNTKTYTIDASASKSSITNGSTVFSIVGEVDQTIDPEYNTSNKASFTGISPSLGEIAITLKSSPDAGNVYLNGLNILEES